MLETFSETEKKLKQIWPPGMLDSSSVPQIRSSHLLLLSPILSVKRGEVRDRPPLHPLLPLYWVEKKIQQALLHYLCTAVQSAEETPQSVTTEFKPKIWSSPGSEVLIAGTSNLFHKQFHCLPWDKYS